jgi:hypothetical protein
MLSRKNALDAVHTGLVSTCSSLNPARRSTQRIGGMGEAEVVGGGSGIGVVEPEAATIAAGMLPFVSVSRKTSRSELPARRGYPRLLPNVFRQSRSGPPRAVRWR